MLHRCPLSCLLTPVHGLYTRYAGGGRAFYAIYGLDNNEKYTAPSTTSLNRSHNIGHGHTSRYRSRTRSTAPPSTVKYESVPSSARARQRRLVILSVAVVGHLLGTFHCRARSFVGFPSPRSVVKLSMYRHWQPRRPRCGQGPSVCSHYQPLAICESSSRGWKEERYSPGIPGASMPIRSHARYVCTIAQARKKRTSPPQWQRCIWRRRLVAAEPRAAEMAQQPLWSCASGDNRQA